MDSKSLSHTRWKCQYHIVFIPKGICDERQRVSVYVAGGCVLYEKREQVEALLQG